MSELRTAFANGLRQVRKMRKLTQQKLAEAANLSLDMVSRLERGAVSPSFESVESLAKGLDVSPLQFFSSRGHDVARSSSRAKALADINRMLAKANDGQLEKYSKVLKALSVD